MKIIKFTFLTALLIVSINILNPIVSAKPKVSLAATKNSRSVGVEKTGVVKWFNDPKGFGFITQDDGGKDLVVVTKEINVPGFKTLAEGQKVYYTLYEDAKGFKATNVRPK